MFELFPQQLKANFTPEQQDYYLQLANELKELLGGQTQEEVLAGGDPEIIQKILEIKQEMLNFVLTKKTREMTRQEEEEKLDREKQSISLDEIERKQNAGEELTKNELKSLYGIDGFGLFFPSSDDNKKRVQDVINQRNIKEDVSYVLDCSEDQVSLTQEEFLDGTDIVYHFGNLDLSSITSAEGLQLPRSISGGLNLSSITSAEGLQLPQSIGGGLDLSSITSAEGLKLPQSIGKGLWLGSLTSAEGLEIPLGVKIIILKHMPNFEIEKLKKKFPHAVFTKF